jgi:hypothetical protein
MANTYLLATVTVSGADTATILTATRTPCKIAIIQALSSNTDDVYFGDSTVDSGDKLGICLAPRESITLGGENNELLLSTFYIASQTTSQKVNVFYLQG